MRVITAEDIKSRALTEDEKGWLADRGRQADVAQNEKLFTGDEDDDESGDGLGADTDNYDQWKNKELIDEAARREPPVDLSNCTKKAEYIAALRAWDVAHPEE